MAAGAPLSRLVLAATSVADDLGYVALADLSRVLGEQAPTNYRIIGGHMVTALVARWGLGAELYRETGDADLGIPPIVVRDQHLIERLTDSGYQWVAGHRFARTVTDVDLWRCLEVAFAAGVEPGEFVEGDGVKAAAIIRALFGAQGGAGMSALVAEHTLSDREADRRFTRLRALMARVLGTG